jgi:hypothetical protein
MKRSPRTSEKPFVFPPRWQARLNHYALAASAAGVSVLALAQGSEAKVVFTKTHAVIGENGVYNLDLTHDGTVDFLIQELDEGGFPSSNALLADPALGNAVQGFRNNASALQLGAAIGPGQKFVAGGFNGEAMVTITHSTTGGVSHVRGLWANTKDAYLGLKFKIGGETHYGWARLSVELNGFHIAATLTGYAYETIPNQAINAGQIDGSAAVPDTPQPLSFSLGALALGAQGVTAWRRQ